MGVGAAGCYHAQGGGFAVKGEGKERKNVLTFSLSPSG
jgi:hypothetical protein